MAQFPIILRLLLLWQVAVVVIVVNVVVSVFILAAVYIVLGCGQ